MANPTPHEAEQDFERILGILLRIGVLIAAAVVLIGGIAYLMKYGTNQPTYAIFHGVPAKLHSWVGIAKDLVTLSGSGTIQAGLLLLILTPVARVLFSVYGFARRHEVVYIVTTLFVLAVLVFSLLGGHF